MKNARQTAILSIIEHNDVETQEELAEKLGCSLYLYDDLGHAAYEDAKDFNRRVLAFLNQ